jgi:ABC-2 type transport system permease protein
MFKLWASIKKDVRILTRDRVGLVLMFAMPILLVIVITSVQNSTFELVNANKVKLLIYNKDTGAASRQLLDAIDKIGMFQLYFISGIYNEKEITERMHGNDALLAIEVPENFSAQVTARARNIASQSLKDIAVQEDSLPVAIEKMEGIRMYYHPVLQQSFRRSIEGAVFSALQLVQSKQIVKKLYFSLHEKEISDTLEAEIVNNQIPIISIPVSRNGSRNIPNASQHNVPAWTVFAMFFIVISLAGNLVKEKLNGSFIRLKTLPTNYYLSLLSKQITYIALTFLQATVIFAIGIWLFPLIGLPKLDLPQDGWGLLLVTLVCGCCAASYAICVGVFAETQEQANGFGAVSVVILAAIGGLLVPSFAMPASFQGIMKISPLHWCLEAYYGLFLEGGKLKDISLNILSLLVITGLLQLLTLWGLKRKNLI